MGFYKVKSIIKSVYLCYPLVVNVNAKSFPDEAINLYKMGVKIKTMHNIANYTHQQMFSDLNYGFRLLTKNHDFSQGVSPKQL